MIYQIGDKVQFTGYNTKSLYLIEVIKEDYESSGIIRGRVLEILIKREAKDFSKNGCIVGKEYNFRKVNLTPVFCQITPFGKFINDIYIKEKGGQIDGKEIL